HLLDIFERRDGAPKQAVRVRLDELTQSLPGYYSQTDPTPRLTSNEQLSQLAAHDYVSLTWEQGQTGHLLESVTLNASHTGPLYELLGRQPLAEQRQRLREMLLGERSHLTGWRRKAVEHCLAQLQAHKSPAPFSLTNLDWNRDLLTVLLELPDSETPDELPYRVFSVRVFNDSKRFEPLKDTVGRLARRYQSAWRDLSPQEALREMGLVANPGHLYLYGPWQLVDDEGQVMSLAEFYPSVGIPATLAARLQRVTIQANRVICVENLAAFYELIRYQGRGIAALCLWGNPSPATRHLLHCLAAELATGIPLLLWADLDYGGLRILAHLRQQVSTRFQPYLMDEAILNRYDRWGQPLTSTDERNLTRLRHHSALEDMIPVIDEILRREVKLEQEAIDLSGLS
ncbi:MAG: DUF2220 family protein, partial [Anaerolineae bacterium]|nr:DUF2220 family protein [Anaerolineae bacterium]